MNKKHALFHKKQGGVCSNKITNILNIIKNRALYEKI